MILIYRFLFLIFLSFGVYQIHSYRELGISSITSWTTLLLWLGLTLLISSSYYFYKKNKSQNKYAYLVILLIMSSFFSLEMFLKYVSKHNLVYNEMNGDNYYESFHRENFDRHYLYQPNDSVFYSTDKFSYSRKVNSLGIVNREIDINKPDHEARIICFGDSFTEGVGASHENGSWPSVLEQNLIKHLKHSKYKSFNVINAGISGSDLAFQFILLKEIFVKYKPDLVVVAINPVDIDEFIVRGGLERFDHPNFLRGEKSPFWEPLYATSFIFRYFIHDILDYNSLFLSKDQDRQEREIAVNKILITLKEFAKLSESAGFKLLFALHPDSGKDFIYHPDSTKLLFRKINQELNTPTIDLMEKLKITRNVQPNNLFNYYWPVSYHHNDQGYNEIAKMIYEKMISDDLLTKL